MSSRSHALPLEPRSPLSLLMPVASPRHASSSSSSSASAAGVRIQARAPPPFALNVHVGAVFVHRQTVGGGDQNFKWLARVVCDALARECKMAPNVFVPVNICDADGRSLLPFDRIREFCGSGDHLYLHLLPPAALPAPALSAPFVAQGLVHPIARAAPAPAHTLVPRAASAAPQPTAAARVDGENALPSPSLGPLAPGNKSTLPTLGGSPTMNATNAAASAAKPIAPMQLDLSSAIAGNAVASPLAGHGHGHGLESARLAMPVPLPMTDAHVHDALLDGNGGDRSSASHWLPPAAVRERTLWELLAYTPAEQFRKVTLVVRLGAPHVMAIEEDPWVRAAAAAGALTASPLAHAPAPIVHGAQQRRMAQLDYRYLHDPADGSFDQNAALQQQQQSQSQQQSQHRNRQSVALASTLCLSPRHTTTTATPAVNLIPAASVVSPAAAATSTGAGAGGAAVAGTAAGQAFFNHVPPPPADAYSALLPKSAVPHITGNFISWGAPLPMIPLVRARAAAVAVAVARSGGQESSSSSSSSSTSDAHGDDADAAAAGGEEGGEHDSGDGSPSSSPQAAAAAPRVRIDAKFAGSSPAASSSSLSSLSSSTGLRSPRPQLLRGLDPSVGEEDVLSAADRDECIERGAYSVDLWMPPGAELLFSIYCNRQPLLSAEHAVAVFPEAHASAGGRRLVNRHQMRAAVADDFRGVGGLPPNEGASASASAGAIEGGGGGGGDGGDDVTVQFATFRRARSVVFASAALARQEERAFAEAATGVSLSAGAAATPRLAAAPPHTFVAVPTLGVPAVRERAAAHDLRDVNVDELCRGGRADKATGASAADRLRTRFALEYEYFADLYRTYAAGSKDPCYVSRREFGAMCAHLRIVDAKLSASAVDAVFDKVCAAFNLSEASGGGGGGGNAGLLASPTPAGLTTAASAAAAAAATEADSVCKRGHFFDILLRLVRQRLPPQASVDDAFDVLLHHYIVPNLAPPTDHLLRAALQTPQCQTELRRHLPAMHAAFKKYTSGSQSAAEAATATGGAPIAVSLNLNNARARPGAAPGGGRPNAATLSASAASSSSSSSLSGAKASSSSSALSSAHFLQILADVGLAASSSAARRRYLQLFYAAQCVACEPGVPSGPFGLLAGQPQPPVQSCAGGPLPPPLLGPRARHELTWPEFIEAVARVADHHFDAQCSAYPRLADRLAAFFANATTWTAFAV